MNEVNRPSLRAGLYPSHALLLGLRRRRQGQGQRLEFDRWVGSDRRDLTLVELADTLIRAGREPKSNRSDAASDATIAAPETIDVRVLLYPREEAHSHRLLRQGYTEVAFAASGFQSALSLTKFLIMPWNFGILNRTEPIAATAQGMKRFWANRSTFVNGRR